jgi:hypothetical protein
MWRRTSQIRGSLAYFSGSSRQKRVLHEIENPRVRGDPGQARQNEWEECHRVSSCAHRPKPIVHSSVLRQIASHGVQEDVSVESDHRSLARSVAWSRILRSSAVLLAERFPDAGIVGVDIVPPQPSWPQSESIEYLQVDQGDRSAIRELFRTLGRTFNLVIEDVADLAG